MLNRLYALASPLIMCLPPEQAHEAALRSLEAGLYPPACPPAASLRVSALGLGFPTPLGIAAGFDKDARVPDANLGLGFGFAEIGTTTPRPQPGNPAPRVFRLVHDKALINRLGFNSAGHAIALKRLQQRAKRGIVGVNIGANRDSQDMAADYVTGLETFSDVASYFMANISSPNTPGLLGLQAPDALDRLLGMMMEARERIATAGRPRPPLIVKISSDIADGELEPIIARLLAHGVDGIAVANTTVSRDNLKDARIGREPGGLSGRPLFHKTTAMLAKVYQITGGKVVLVGNGGVDSGEAALAKIEAGANLLQLYTGLVFEGPALVSRINRHLAEAVAAAGAKSISELVGRRAGEWSSQQIAA